MNLKEKMHKFNQKFDKVENKIDDVGHSLEIDKLVDDLADGHKLDNNQILFLEKNYSDFVDSVSKLLTRSYKDSLHDDEIYEAVAYDELRLFVEDTGELHVSTATLIKLVQNLDSIRDQLINQSLLSSHDYLKKFNER